MSKEKLAQAKQELKAAARLEAAMRARDSMLAFSRFTMPDAKDPDDSSKSRYITTAHGKMLCEIIEKIERRELKRVAVSIGPQFGKSQVLSRNAPAWISGRNPFANLILGTYNQPFADQFGGQVRAIVSTTAYQQVFPGHGLDVSQMGYFVTHKGGQMKFVGVGGSATGNPADFFFIDDPIKDSADANSEAFREGLWRWFNSVVFSRCHDDTAILIVSTRWHEDDLIGRLCDSDHPERSKKYAGIADGWTYINIPAVIADPKLAAVLGLELTPQTDKNVVDQFGPLPITSLWPGRKSLPLLAEAKRLDARDFNALYMGKPAPDDGDYFKAEWLVPYHSADELPKSLRIYGASDHAVSAKQIADSTVLGCVGVDYRDDVWVLPDIVWRRMETDATVDELLLQFQMHKPQLWWMESELISKSFGPFLRKRMAEEKIYVTIDPVTVAHDKRTRGRAIQGRMSNRRVHFPVFAPWWPDAKSQILKFPYATHDDFVDWLAHIGMGLLKEIAAPVAKDDKVVNVGSIAWILAKSRQKALRDKHSKAVAGW